jgi:hypothetical protein
MRTLHPKVSQRILTKADWLFTNNLGDIFVELIQNARRAGARTIDVTAQNSASARLLNSLASRLPLYTSSCKPIVPISHRCLERCAESRESSRSRPSSQSRTTIGPTHFHPPVSLSRNDGHPEKRR